MPAPCGGCPSCCKDCVFSATALPSPAKKRQVVVEKQDYGCVRADGGDVVVSDGVLGMMRGEGFHPVRAEGAAFLHASNNPLSAYC